MTTIIGIQVENRRESVKEVQDILTEYGCDIKTRLGINDYQENGCTYKGLILIDVPKRNMADEIINKLGEIKKVIVKEMEF